MTATDFADERDSSSKKLMFLHKQPDREKILAPLEAGTTSNTKPRVSACDSNVASTLPSTASLVFYDESSSDEPVQVRAVPWLWPLLRNTVLFGWFTSYSVFISRHLIFNFSFFSTFRLGRRISQSSRDSHKISTHIVRFLENYSTSSRIVCGLCSSYSSYIKTMWDEWRLLHNLVSIFKVENMLPGKAEKKRRISTTPIKRFSSSFQQNHCNISAI